jgi:hypothetical protein
VFSTKNRAEAPKIVAQGLDIVTHPCETVTHQLTEDLTMAIDEICAAYPGVTPVLLASSAVLFRINPAHPVHLSVGLKDTGLVVGATPSKRIGVIVEATGEVLGEWNGR